MKEPTMFDAVSAAIDAASPGVSHDEPIATEDPIVDDSSADQTDGLGDTLEHVEEEPKGEEAPKEGTEGAGDGEPQTEAEIAAKAAADAAKPKPEAGKGDLDKPKAELKVEPEIGRAH